jgi:surface protein
LRATLSLEFGMRTFAPRRALVALACVLLAVLLGILGWRGLSFAEGLVEGEDYGVVTTMEDPAVSISMPSTARLKLLRAETASDESTVEAGVQSDAAVDGTGDVNVDTAFYLGYSSAEGTVANESTGTTAAEVRDHTVRVTLRDGLFEASGVTGVLGSSAKSIDLVPGSAVTATFNQEALAGLSTTQEQAFNEGVHTELARLSEARGATYPSTSAALDELGYDLAYVNFPTATTVSIVGETGEVEACYTPGQKVFCKLENVPEGAAVMVAWYSVDTRGNRQELLGEGWSLLLQEAYDGLIAVVTDLSGLYLGEVVPQTPALVKTLAPYAVYFEEDNSVEIYTALLPAAVGDTVNEKTVTAVDSSIESLNSLASYASKVKSVTVMDPFDFPGTSLAGYFSGYSSCEEFDLALMGTSGVTTFANMFANCTTVESLSLSSFSTDAATSLEGMFKNCSSLTQVDVATFNTSHVTNFVNTFYGCTSMEELDLTAWDVSSAGSLAGMMAGMTSLANVDVASWDTSGVASFASMFEGDTALEQLDLSNVSTEGATNLIGMFKGCTSLTELDLASFKTTSVTNMSNMFAGDAALATIYASEDLWSNEKAVNSTGVFTGCEVVVGGNGTEYSASYVGGTRATIDRAGQEGYLTDASIACTTFAVYSETDYSVTIYNARVLPKVGAKYQGKVVTALDSTIESLDEFEEFKDKVTSVRVAEELAVPSAANPDQPATSLAGYFEGYSAATAFDLLNLDVSAVTNFNSMFEECEAVKELNLKCFELAEGVTIERMFAGCSTLKTVYVDSDNWHFSNIDPSYNVFEGCENIKGGAGTTFDASHIDYDYAKVDSLRIKGYLTEAPVVPFAIYTAEDNGIHVYAKKEVPEVGQEYDGRIITAIDTSIESLDALAAYKKVATSITVEEDAQFPSNSLSGWLMGWTALETANLEHLLSKDLVSTYRLFYGCTALTTAIFENLDTSEVTTIGEMFYGCTALTKVEIGCFDTAAVTAMYGMFYNCQSLVSLNLTSFDTGRVTNMNYAFYNCKNIQAIYGDNSKWTAANLIYGSEIFYNCVKLVGGIGTPYSIYHRGATRAWVDYVGHLGYLTDPTLPTPAYAVYSATDNSVRIYDRSPQPIIGETFNGLEVTAIDRTIDTLDDLAAYKTVATSLVCEDETTFPVASMYLWLYNWTALTTVDLSLLDTSEVTNMQQLFYCCRNIASFNLDGWDTSNVTNMSYMFMYCDAVTELDLSSFSTPKVTTMRQMFCDVPKVETIDITGFSATSLKDVYAMFCRCYELTTIYATDGLWNPTAVTSASYVFSDSTKLVGGNGTTYSDPHSRYVVDKDGQAGYFTDKTLQTAGFGVYSADDNGIILYSGDATPRPGQKYDGRTVTAVDGSLGSLDALSAYKTVATFIKMKSDIVFPATTMANWLNGWTALKTVDLSRLDTHNVTNMQQLFYNCKALTSLNVSGWDTSNVTDMSYMFMLCNTITYLDLTSFTTEKVTTMRQMFCDVPRVETIDISSFSPNVLKDVYAMFCRCYALTTIYATDDLWKPTEITSGAYVFTDCAKLTGGNGTKCIDSSHLYALVDKDGQAGYFTDKTLVGAGFAVYSIDDNGVIVYGPGVAPRPGEVYDGRTVTAVDGSLESLDGLSSYKTKATFFTMKGKVTFPGTSMASWLNGWTALKTIDLSLLDTQNVTNMQYLFYDCVALTALDVSGWNTHNVTDMSFMFMNCKVIKELDLSSFATEKVTTMKQMFCDVPKVETIDISSFSAAVLKDIYAMFCRCYELTTIYATDGLWNPTAVTSASYVFSDSTKLTGGNGTKNTDPHSRYVVDKDGQAGYFTDRSIQTAGFGVYSTDDNGIILYSGDVAPRPGQTYDGRTVTAVDGSLESLDGLQAYITTATSLTMKSNVTFPGTTMAKWLYGWTALKTIDLSLLNTQNVTNMQELFYNCNAATTITVSGWNTSNVTNMSYMFQLCKAVKELDLTSFNTAKVTNMQQMFCDVWAAETIDMSSFSAASVTNITHMFTRCYAVETIYASDALWRPQKITSGGNCFSETSKVIGGAGTYFGIDSHTYAMVDKDGQLGYFTDKSLVTAGFAVFSLDDYAVKLYSGDVTPRPGTVYDGRTVTAVDGSLESLNGLDNYQTAATSVMMKQKITFPGTSMAKWLNGWTALKTIDLSLLNTQNVTNMQSLFDSCKAAASIDVSGWDTQNVTDMSYMFANCSAITAIDLTSFTTEKVTTMKQMFCDVPKVKTIDISSFSAAALKDIYAMFCRCYELTTIYATDGLWNPTAVTSASYVFSDSTKLIGGSGTKNTDPHSRYVVDKDGQAGCFTDRELVTTAFGVYSEDDHEIHFYSGDVTPRPGTTYKGRKVTAVDGSLATFDGFDDYKTAVTALRTKASFKFPGTSMYYFFRGWTSLKTVDFSRMNTEHVTDMSYMFFGLSSLVSVDLSGFDTSKVTTFADMFYNCTGITSLDVSSFSTSTAKSLYAMFYNCSSITTIDISKFVYVSGADLAYLFYGCKSLTTIYADEALWGATPAAYSYSFTLCSTNLVGGNGTVWNASYTDASYARMDKDGQPGYFTQKTAGASVAVLALEDAASVACVEAIEEPPASTNLEVGSSENAVQEVEPAQDAEKYSEVVVPEECAGEAGVDTDVVIATGDTTGAGLTGEGVDTAATGDLASAEASAELSTIDFNEPMMAKQAGEASELGEVTAEAVTVEPEVEEVGEPAAISFEEVAAAVAVVPAGMLLAALRRRAA